jgi:hypothetical protein
MGWTGVGLMAVLLMANAGQAQMCVTQARMDAPLRDGLASAALAVGRTVQAGDVGALKAASSMQLAGDFSAVERTVDETGGKLSGDELRVVQVYELDASAVKASGAMDFSCLLKASPAEVDFNFNMLQKAVYGFAMVEASGSGKAWLLSMLLEQEGGGWKLAGLYPHARTAVGRDGLWYWAAARDRVKAKQPWLAWLDYEEAAALLSPAPFVTSTEMDKLRSEQRTAAPQGLSDGVSPQTPLVVKGKDGTAFRFTSLTSEPASDDLSLQLVLRYADKAIEGAEANRVRDMAAAAALVDAHPELKAGYGAVIVFGDVEGRTPSVLVISMSQLQAV